MLLLLFSFSGADCSILDESNTSGSTSGSGTTTGSTTTGTDSGSTSGGTTTPTTPSTPTDPCAGINCPENTYCEGGSCYCLTGYEPNAEGTACVISDPCVRK